MYALVLWGETRLHPWLLIAGGLMGLAAASKPAAALMAGPAIIYIVRSAYASQGDEGRGPMGSEQVELIGCR